MYVRVYTIRIYQVVCPPLRALRARKQGGDRQLSGPRSQNFGQILADFTLRNQQILIFFARLRRALVKFTLRNQQIALFFRAPAARSSQIYP